MAVLRERNRKCKENVAMKEGKKIRTSPFYLSFWKRLSIRKLKFGYLCAHFSNALTRYVQKWIRNNMRSTFSGLNVSESILRSGRFA
jgi:hypothetical protein